MHRTILRDRVVLYKGSQERRGLVLPSLETSFGFDLFAAPGTRTLTQLVNKTAGQRSRPFTCQNALLTKKSPTIFERTFTLKTNMAESNRIKGNACFNYTSSGEKHCSHEACKQIHSTASTWQNSSGRYWRPHHQKNRKASIA